MVPPKNVSIGECSDGYQGVMCMDCAVGYSRTNGYFCSKCPLFKFNILRLLGILLIAVLFGVVLIRSTLVLGRKNVVSFQSVYMRILMNHLQLIILTASFHLDWPQKVLQFFANVRLFSNMATQLISIDCFLDKRGFLDYLN